MANNIKNSKKNTLDRPLGLLIDGTELYSPSIFNESIYFGGISQVDISNSGKNYDVITPSSLTIRGNSGISSGAKIYGNMMGELTEILVLSPGIGYKTKPNLSIVGGNFKGSVKLDTNLLQRSINSAFLPNSVGVASSTITFISDHNFEDGDEIIYNSNNSISVTGLIPTTSYFVGIIDSKTISLYNTVSDALNKVNFIGTLVPIAGVTTSIHYFHTRNVKNIIDKVYIENSDAIFYNRIVKIPNNSHPNSRDLNGISTIEDYIYAKNHNLKEGDLVVYSSTGSIIAGLNTTSQYFVTVVDENKFKLSNAGSSKINPNKQDYLNEVYVNFTSRGSGTHIFKYPDIEIITSVVAGITSTKAPSLEPVVLGSFDSIFIEDEGSGYGVSNVVNLQVFPDVIIEGTNLEGVSLSNEASFQPVIVDGKIIDVIVLNSGDNYNKNIDIIVEGQGKYARLYPTIENKKITKVSVLSEGVGYDLLSTRIYAKRRGIGAKFLANVKKWTINQYFKNKTTIDSNSGNSYVVPSRNVKNSLQSITFYPPGELRDLVKDGEAFRDANQINEPSPILGWAYDGNPIFGPYIENENTSGITLIPSSYRLKNTNTLNNLLKRPRGFAGGYFIEDYEYVESLSQLDENNGMYLKNSDLFPNGTYAYFLTLNPSDKSPTYPYVVGPEFKNEPNEVNFDSSQNQNIDFTDKSYLKNTSSLYLTSTNSGYDYINPIQDKYKQELIVKNVLSSKIDGFKIINSGTGYKIGDRLEFSSTSSDDFPPDAIVFELTGKKINNIIVGITTISDVKFKIKNNEVIGVSSAPHTIKNNDYITIKNSNNSNLNSVQNVEVVQKTCNILSNHNSSGVSTYIEVDDITVFEVNDYITIDDEIAKILEIYPTSSKFFIERLVNVGVHTSGVSLVKILPSKFKFRNKSILGGLTVENQRYFNPKYSIGIGTTGTIVNNTESYLTYFIPEKCIHIPNHNYTTNQEVIYTKNSSFNGLLVSNTPTSTPYRLQNNQTLYVINQGKDLIGLTTVAYGATSLTFRETSYLDDEIHSFKYTRNETIGDINVFSLQVDTSSSHNLIDGDEVTLDAVEDTFEYYVAQIDFNQTYKVNIVNNSNFKLNLKNKPQFIEFPETQNPPLAIKALNPNNFKYNTKSRTASGGIKNVKLINSSSFYKEIPTVTSIDSVNGDGAIILATSKTIGKIDTVERIKDGFDYPSDITLQPKLSTNIICYVTDNKKIRTVDVVSPGSKYNTPPNLKVIGRDDIVLKSNLRNFSVSSVKIVKNVTNLSDSLEIIPINNSNGFDILDIFNVSPDTNRILVDKNQFPFIYSDYASPEIDFPFEIGDYIFIENCKVTDSGELNYNSSNFNYSSFEVVGINTNLGRIDYRVTQSDFGTYTTDNGYGTVINKKDLAVFEMRLETCDFYQGESVEALFSDGNVKFSGNIIDVDGWNKQKNQLRLTNSFGTLDVGDILKGSKSLIEAKIIDTNSFTSQVKFGSSRLKVNNMNEFNDLNSDIKRLQDSNYYQDFSYSIVSKVQYDEWKEPVKSIIHPSGFKEFSDLQIISRSKNKNLRVGLGSDSSNLLFNVVIENEKYLGTRDNFTIGYDENRTSTVDRVYFGSGDEPWPVAGYGLTNVSGLQLIPFISNKSNQVIPLKLDGDFDGSYDIISLGAYSVTFNSNSPYYLGISTIGLSVGDIIGISTYNQYPNNTRIISVGINSVRILHPHKVYSGSVTQTLEIKRNLNGNQLVGISSFKLLTNTNKSPFVVLAEPLNLRLGQDLIVKSHNFQTGQLLKYENIGGNGIGISQTSDVIGGISTNKLPPLVYVNRVSSNRFTLSGLSTSNPLNLTSIGSGIHKFTSTNQNESSLILIDNIIQSPLTKRNLNLSLSQDVGINTNIIYANSGITSITSIDILKIQNEYLKIISVGVSSENAIEVERGFLGSSILDHSGIQTTSVYRGNYLIVDDDIYFTEPPFGISGLEGLQVSSKFTGRAFSRTFSPQYPNDRNIILDDISNQFVGLSSFILKENGNDVVGLYTNTNSSSLGNINNNPIILINNIPQVTNLNFTIDNPNQNTINFISGNPKIGKILRFKANDNNFGYSPLVAAAATVAVSPSGEISQVYLNGGGSGYRIKPNIEVVSRVGSGASISATVGASGSITSFTIVTPGIGYSTTEPPELIIDEPIPYYDLNVNYASSSSGIGTNAKVSLSINQNSKVDNIELINSGENYKVGDILNVVGVVTNTQAGNLFNILELEVTEVESDIFSGIYPGQFIQFEDISSNFNSVIDSFDLYAVIDGVRTKILFKSDNTNKVENNFFIFLNDILQEPLLAYKYVAGRLFFTEPPVEGSTCNILYYQGSIRDVDLVKPKQTIKVGDEVKLEDSDLNSILISQDSRVVRRIVASNELDTFAYSDVGIFPEKVRPITWTKQKNDRIISGSLISKSREMYESRLYPTSKLIWKIQPEDTSFYVDNAYPLFKEYDDGIGILTKDQRSVSIIQLNSHQTAEFDVNVSTSSTISSINVENGGVGYTTNTPIYINSPQYDLKDPLYQWNFTSGISTTYQFNSIVSGDVIIAVGNTNLIGISSSLNVWTYDVFTISPTINLNKVATSSFNNYYAVGSNGKIIKKGDKNSPWSVCGIKTESFIFGISQGVFDSNYTGTFNDIVYNPNIDTWIAVGNGGKIYSGIGISTDVFMESISSQPYDYKSVDYNSNVIIAVGSGGVSRSSDARTWFNVGLSGNYTCVFWSESDNSFIASFDNKIGVSTNGTNWSQFTINPSINLVKLVKYNKVYIGIDDTNSIYTSIDLRNWLKRDLPSATEVYEIENIIIDNNDYITLVGAAGSIYYSTPVLHSAIVEANISNNQILSINILDGGFGYSIDTPPSIIAETPSSNISVVNSIDVIGDYGKIVGIKTANTGVGTNSPRISFEFLSDYDTLNQFGVSYSNISVGDYFMIFNSNVGTLTGYALTGITTSLGGMSNYPESKVGTATTFLDGVYKVDYIENTSLPQGIVTVTCHVVPVNGGVAINTSGVTTNYYGNYSWSKIFNYNQKSIEFDVNTDNGLVGLNTGPIIQRKPSLIF